MRLHDGDGREKSRAKREAQGVGDMIRVRTGKAEGRTEATSEERRPNKNKRMSASTYFHGMPYQWDRYAASERGMCSGEKRGDRAVEIV